MFKHLLVPTDGSALSARAVKHAVALAKSCGARVTGFYVAPPYNVQMYAEYVPAGFVSPQEFAKQMKKVAERHLGAVRKAAAAARVRCDTDYVASDRPWEAIVAVAKKRKCDLIFMASHGRRGLAGFLLGSETQKVLTHSKIPVLVHR